MLPGNLFTYERYYFVSFLVFIFFNISAAFSLPPRPNARQIAPNTKIKALVIISCAILSWPNARITVKMTEYYN